MPQTVISGRVDLQRVDGDAREIGEQPSRLTRVVARLKQLLPGDRDFAAVGGCVASAGQATARTNDRTSSEGGLLAFSARGHGVNEKFEHILALFCVRCGQRSTIAQRSDHRDHSASQSMLDHSEALWTFVDSLDVENESRVAARRR